MPNHCHNRVNFYNEDNPEQIKELHDIFSRGLDENEERSVFGAFIPEPDWTKTPLTENTVKEYSFSDPRGEVGECSVMMKNENPFLAGLRFPSTNNVDDRWYDWRNQHWGTKWDCYEVQIDEELPYGFKVTFDTAWAPPEPVCEAIREKYPDISVQWHYDEPGMEFCGYLQE